MNADETLPILPYAGTSGWSGSETSRERAEREDSDGTTGKRQRAALHRLHTAFARGLTWNELGDLEGWHHGQVSAVLTGLHKRGVIARLAERRGRSQVYVLPEYVEGRETRPYLPNRRVLLVKDQAARERTAKAFDAIVAWFMDTGSESSDYDAIMDGLLADLDAIKAGEQA